MKNFLILFILMGSINSFAQTEWAPIGAKWYYNQPSSTTGNYVLLESLKDTVIEGKSARVIEIRLNGVTHICSEYIHQSKDSVYYYNDNSKSFHLLYNFSAKSGDTITVHRNKFKPTKGFFSYNDSITNFKYKIISIDSIQLSETWIQRQKVESLHEGDWCFSKAQNEDYYILDKIGSLAYLFGVFGGIIPEEHPSILRCYYEHNLGYKNPTYNEECDSYNSISNIPANTRCQIYPNPVKNQLNISAIDNIDYIEICNNNGISIFSISPRKNSICIDTEPLKQGLYFIKIRINQNVYFQKLIKN